jgi:hypothetical protein
MRRSIRANGSVEAVDGQPMVHLTTVTGAFHARVVAARLGADGIVTSVRGCPEGPYPVLGPVDVLVSVDDFETARDLLHADAVAVADVPPLPRPSAARQYWLVAAVILVSFCVVAFRGL